VDRCSDAVCPMADAVCPMADAVCPTDNAVCPTADGTAHDLTGADYLMKLFWDVN
jgi:hypothetical protein